MMEAWVPLDTTRWSPLDTTRWSPHLALNRPLPLKYAVQSRNELRQMDLNLDLVHED